MYFLYANIDLRYDSVCMTTCTAIQVDKDNSCLCMKRLEIHVTQDAIAESDSEDEGHDTAT